MRTALLLITFLFVCLPSSYAGDSADLDPTIKHAVSVIRNDYGDRVLVTNKAKSILKFGRNMAVGTSYATIMALPSGEVHETYVTTNVIDKFSSSSTSDNTQTMRVEGHTCSGGVPTTFVVQTVTLDGQNETALTTPLCRVTRAFNTGAAMIVGSIYFYEDDTVSGGVPQTATKIHLIIPTGRQQSVKAATALSATDYAICTEVYGSVVEKAASYADFEIEVRSPGGVFREQLQFTASDGSGTTFFNLDPALIVPKSADIRLIAKADNADTVVSGGFNCYLAVVQ